MKLRLISFASLMLLLFSGACQERGYRAVQQYSVEQFMNTVSIGGSSFSPDEDQILFSSNASGIYNAYTVPVTGGAAVQLTHSTDNSIFTLSYFPHDGRILYSSDQGGNEINHIYLREEDGSTRDLTPHEGAKTQFYGWSYDKKGFYYGTNQRDPRFFDLYEMDIATFTPTEVFRNEDGYYVGAVSNDERYLALYKPITRNNSDLYLYDRDSGEIIHLSPHEGDINYDPQTFSVDSKSLYYLTDEGREFTYLMRYDIASDRSSRVQEEDWDIWYTYFSHHGKYRVTGVNADGRTRIKILNTATGREVTLPDLPAGDITNVNISRSEGLMTFYHNGSRSPSNLYVYDFGRRDFRRLTNTLNPEIDPEDLVEAEVIRYPSFDGLEIPAIYYRPRQLRRGDKAPALVWVHGGPGSQSRIGYRSLLQLLANRGYVVLAVNNRGSSGYGKTFFKLDDRNHGQGDLDDCVTAKEFLASTGYVDPERIGIIGGSYGGYMVMAALTFRPEEFAVGVNIYGVTNWVRTLKSIPPWWEAYRQALYQELGDPETDEDYLRSISPLFHAAKIVRPVQVFQGANDPRVLKVESDEIVAAARANGVPVEYVVFEDEGHGFVKKENQVSQREAILSFLETYLNKPDG